MSKQKFLLVAGIVFGAMFVGIPLATVIQNHNSVHFTLLENAGLLLEYKGTRIYVDPIALPPEFDDKPADVICVTHPHGDHYVEYSKCQRYTLKTVNLSHLSYWYSIRIF